MLSSPNRFAPSPSTVPLACMTWAGVPLQRIWSRSSTHNCIRQYFFLRNQTFRWYCCTWDLDTTWCFYCDLWIACSAIVSIFLGIGTGIFALCCRFLLRLRSAGTLEIQNGARPRYILVGGILWRRRQHLSLSPSPTNTRPNYKH